MNEGVLAGIRVLDFGRFIAGPFCGALLADHGADVIRVDKVGGSEDRCVLPLADSGEGGLYMQVNRGKRSLQLDPGAPEGREIVNKLIARADIVIANLPGRHAAIDGARLCERVGDQPARDPGGHSMRSAPPGRMRTGSASTAWARRCRARCT